MLPSVWSSLRTAIPATSAPAMSIHGLDDVARDCPDVQLRFAGVKQQGDQLVTAGGRVLTVVATAPSFEIAIARAYEAASKIRFDGMQYRRDIGQASSQRALCLLYSSLSATIGSIEAARRAGSQLASSPTPISSTTMIAITCGSPGCTW